MKELSCRLIMPTLVFASLLSAGETSAPESPARTPSAGSEQRAPLPESGRKFRSGPGIWQVFSRLSPEERRKMQKLQREDPAKFREVMQAKADALFRKRQERMAELRELAKQCRESGNSEEREKLRSRLSAEVEKDFREHLAANRRQLEDMKRQAERMERHLKRREADCSRAVAAMVEALIRGEEPGMRPQNRK